MTIFTRKKNKTAILNHEDLKSYWLYITNNFIEISEKRGQESGLDAFGSTLTAEGFFGVKKELLFFYLINPFHMDNFIASNIKFPLSENEALKLIVKFGPLWIVSITQVYKNKLYQQSSKELNLNLAIISLMVVGSIVSVLDKKTEIQEYNSEEMAEVSRKAFMQMKELDGGL